MIDKDCSTVWPWSGYVVLAIYVVHLCIYVYYRQTNHTPTYHTSHNPLTLTVRLFEYWQIIDCWAVGRVKGLSRDPLGWRESKPRRLPHCIPFAAASYLYLYILTTYLFMSWSRSWCWCWPIAFAGPETHESPREMETERGKSLYSPPDPRTHYTTLYYKHMRYGTRAHQSSLELLFCIAFRVAFVCFLISHLTGVAVLTWEGGAGARTPGRWPLIKIIRDAASQCEN